MKRCWRRKNRRTSPWFGDTDAPTFRHEMDEEDKANRPPQPEELKVEFR
ncbi:MAG: hypothetical protein U5K69_25775 [Balneolaceae bacterium]|nr:hypothetical protein [Balneolaceae bacterium]